MTKSNRKAKIEDLNRQLAGLKGQLEHIESGKSEEDDILAAQALIDLLFVKFKKGGAWINNGIKVAGRTYVAKSPIGRWRHLWGYFHNRTGVINAMNRRAGNSIIQGTASDILQYAATELTNKVWHYFVKHGVPFYANHPGHPAGPCNYVHDSIKSDIQVIHIPIYMYLLETAMCHDVHKSYRRIFGFKQLVGMEIEFSFGASADRMDDWDWNVDSLGVTKTDKDKDGNAMQVACPPLTTIIYDKVIEASALYPDYWTDKVIACTMRVFNHNLKIVHDIRIAELKADLEVGRNPSENQTINESNARSLGLIFDLADYKQAA